MGLVRQGSRVKGDDQQRLSMDVYEDLVASLIVRRESIKRTERDRRWCLHAREGMTSLRPDEKGRYPEFTVCMSVCYFFFLFWFG